MAWTIDAAHTLVEFSVKHMMIATVRGRFNSFSGVVDIDEANPERSRVEGTVSTASVDTRDAGRDAHLRSADFFDVENYPEMTFRGTRIERKGEGRYDVTGDLTIRGTSREVVLDVTDEGQLKDPWGNVKRGFSARTAINRKDYGLTWNVGLEAGGWLVGDQVKIEIEAELAYQPAGDLVGAASA